LFKYIFKLKDGYCKIEEWCAYEEPEAIYKGKTGEFLGMKEVKSGKYIVWTTYDKEADVLYINFKKPSHADDSEITENDIIIRYEKEEPVGITILNASKRKEIKL